MTTYTAVFGSDTIPPAGQSYVALAFAANTTLTWPYNTSGGTSTAKIMDCTPSAASLSITLPSAMEVSVGEDILIRNFGADAFTVLDALGGTVCTVDPSTAKYLYLTNNATADGDWAAITFGSGASAVDAAALVGYGLKAIGATLNTAHTVFDTATGINVTSIYRAALINFTGGVATLTMAATSGLGNNFYFLLRNSGTGTLTVNPDGAELVDGQSTLSLNPNESVMLVASDTAWFSVGLGRSLQYNFTQLVKDVSTGSPFTLTASEASNKLLKFIGNPSAGVTIIVPSVVSVYYVYSDITTAQDITVQTLTGSGAVVAQGARSILFCDATDVVSAQSAATSSATSFLDGSVTTPSIKWTTKTNTGFFKYGTEGIGFAINGALGGFVDATGINNASSEILASRAWVESHFPAGMPMLFYSNTAPTGWTKVTTAALDNTALRIVSDGSQSGGNGGVTGGTATFNAVFGASKSTATGYADLAAHTHTYSGSTGNDSPDHTHGYSAPAAYVGTGSTPNYFLSTSAAANTGGASARHTHAFSGTTASTGTGAGHTHALNFDVRYASFIVATKDAY